MVLFYLLFYCFSIIDLICSIKYSSILIKNPSTYIKKYIDYYLYYHSFKVSTHSLIITCSDNFFFFCKCDVCVSVVTINKMLIITKHFWTVCQRLTEITPLYSDCQILKTYNCSIFINFAVIFFQAGYF